VDSEKCQDIKIESGYIYIMNQQSEYFLPTYVEIGGVLYFHYPSGDIVKVPDDQIEIPLGALSINVSATNIDILRNCYHDRLNPYVERKCEECGNAIQKNIIFNDQNVYICECKSITYGNYISL